MAIKKGNKKSSDTFFIKGDVKLSYRPKYIRPVITLREPKDAYPIFLKTWDKNILQYREEFKLMLLNQALNVMAVLSLNIGSLNYALADVRIIFQTCLLYNASRLIIAHNHPSGNLKFSEQDKKLTEKIFYCGLLMDIELLDSFIITANGFNSMITENCFPIKGKEERNNLTYPVARELFVEYFQNS